MILSEFHLGGIASHKLMKYQKQSKIDKKLSLNYLVEQINLFKIVLFDHAYTNGLKLTQYKGDEFYELHVDSISLPDSRKHRVNISWVLTHITADQQLIQTFYTSNVENMNLDRYTVKAILTFVTELFNSHAEGILDVIQNGIDESLYQDLKKSTYWTDKANYEWHMMKMFGLKGFTKYEKELRGVSWGYY